MARQVLPIVGAVVGGYFGGAQGAQIGYAIGSLVGNAIDPLVVNGPKIGDAGIQTSEEGVFCPVVYGTAAVYGNIICTGPRIIRKFRERQGKGGPVTETERQYRTFAIRVAEPVTILLRIWQDEKLVYDIRPESTIVAESTEYAGRFRFYDGSESQMPDPDLEAFLGAGNAPAYRGRSYIVFPNFDLTDLGGRIPSFRFEVASGGQSFQSGKWIFGPVAQNGPAGGPQNYYMTTNDPLNWTDIHESPPWVNIIGRISTANGVAFMASGLGGFTAAVSFDKGVTWIECDSNISSDHNVHWNGDYYYCLNIRSADGISWEPIPNLPTGVYDLTARDSDGMIIVAYITVTNAAISYSVDNGSTWSDPVFDLNPAYLTTNSGRLVFTAGSTNAVWTDDQITFNSSSVSDGTGAFTPFFGENGTWLRKGQGARLLRSTDNSVSYVVQYKLRDYGPHILNSIAYSTETGEWVAGTVTAGDPVEWILEVSTNNAIDWSDSNILYGTGGSVAFIGGGTSGTGTTIDLADLVSAIHGRVYQDSSEFDVTDLAGREVAGMVLSGNFTAADAIRTLQGCYFFDSPEYDNGTGYKIRHTKRGKPIVKVITDDDIMEAPQKSVREDPLERPRKLHLHYQSYLIGYAPAKATARRDSVDVRVVGEITSQVPVTFNNVDEPTRIADQLLRIAWVEVAGEEDLVLGDNHLDLVVGDCIGLSRRGQTRRMRIVQDATEAGLQRYKMIADRQSAYTSNVTGIPLPEPTPPPPTLVGDTLFAFMDIPALNDGNDRLLWYEGASGQTEAWHGAQTQRKIAPATDFENSVTFNSNTVMGLLQSNVPAASEHFTDTTNTVRVQLFTNDVLDSITQAQFLSEGGSFALQNVDGSWEILQYRDSADEGNNTFALTTLLRGRLNTGGSAHLAGSMFVLLDTVRTSDATTSMIGQTVISRAISFGQSPDAADQFSNQYTAKSQTEFPVANILGEIVGTTLNARAVPRHRFGTEDTPVRSVNWVGYRWFVTDGANSISLEATPDNQSFDITGWASPVSVTVSQLNRFTGAGPSVTEQFT